MDAFHNLALSGGLAAAGLAARAYLHRRLSTVRILPASEENADADAIAVATDLREPLEQFLRTKPAEFVGREGSEFDIEALVEAETFRHAGIPVEEIFLEERSQPRAYRFIIAYSSAVQRGNNIIQPYVTLLAKGVAQALNDMGHPVAIHALGKNMVVVKRFQDPLDTRAIGKVRRDPVLNLHQGVEATAAVANMDATETTMAFFFLNGLSPVNDSNYRASVQFDHTARVYSLQFGHRNGFNPFHARPGKQPWMGELPHAYAESRSVASVEEMKRGFAEMLVHARQYR